MSFPYYFTWSAQNSAPHFELSSCKDSSFFTPEGKKIWDAISSSFQVNFGHSNKTILESIKKQMDSFSVAPPKACFSLKEEVSLKLLSLLGLEGKIFFTTSGAESIENALKMARHIKKAKYVMARQRSYHGASIGALSVTGDWRQENHLGLQEFTIRIPEPDHDPFGHKLEELVLKKGPDQIAAICVETITGANGVIIPPQSWWDAVDRIKKKYQLFLIIDEVFCGFYRTGKIFGLQHYQNINPDFICLSKGISGGFIPFGAVYTSLEVAQYYDHNVLSCGLTHYAHPLGLAACKGVIEFCQGKFFQSHFPQTLDAFSQLVKRLRTVMPVKTHRSIGMLAAFEFQSKIKTSWFDYIESGIHLLVKDNILIIGPPLTTTHLELDQMFEIIISETTFES